MSQFIAINDSNHKLDYGYWRCQKCSSEFYGGGKAMHRDGCPSKGYENTDYYYSPKEERLWKREVKEKGFVAHLPLSPAGLSDFFLKQAISKGEITPEGIKQTTANYVNSLSPESLEGINQRLEALIQSI